MIYLMFFKIRSLFDKTRSFLNKSIEFFSFEFCGENLNDYSYAKIFCSKIDNAFSCAHRFDGM
ncbi:hypothetical protein M2372_000595 [Chryseobacterium sp. BIGb0232]|nr:hypothetical protein [Chryseobacterium sp. BIGb0232]ROS19975.1 hypothetical protein EDF65_0675 [Chryseobacterium nakagawai]